MDGDRLADCIKRAQRGDPAAFDHLVEGYAARLYGFFFRLTGSRTDAEDLMQEVFVRLVRMIGAYTHDGRFEAWLFRIAANLVRDRVRKARREPKQMVGAVGLENQNQSGADVLDELPGPPDEADRRLLQIEESDALNAALHQLPDAERDVILLRHFSQMSFKEIADLMGTPLGTALARGHRGLARLREIMGPGEKKFDRSQGAAVSGMVA